MPSRHFTRRANHEQLDDGSSLASCLLFLPHPSIISKPIGSLGTRLSVDYQSQPSQMSSLSSLRLPSRSLTFPTLRQVRCFRSGSIARALLSEVIKSHHREIEECYTKALNGKSHDEKERWGNQFTWELARHAIGEDLVLYPKVEKHLPNGLELAHRDRVHTNQVSFSVKTARYLRSTTYHC